MTFDKFILQGKMTPQRASDQAQRFKNQMLLHTLFFVRGEQGLSVFELKRWLPLSSQEINLLIDNLNVWLQEQGLFLTITFHNTKYVMRTTPQFFPVWAKIFTPQRKIVLSKASWETLVIIAYQGPVTRVQVESVRRVSSGTVINNLIAKNLIHKIKSKKHFASRYQVTDHFFTLLNLKNKSDLPQYAPNFLTPVSSKAKRDLFFQPSFEDEHKSKG